MTDYAIVLTHNRPKLLAATVDAIGPQVGLVVIVDNASTPPVTQTWESSNYFLVRDDTQPPNIARMWNAYFDLIQRADDAGHGHTWNVAVLCDDAPPPPGWFATVVDGMRAAGCVAGSTHSYEPVTDGYTLTDLTNTPDRMCPWAFVVAGEARLRADERLRIHYQDTDLDWKARQRGGTRIVPGPVVRNLRVGENPDRPEYAHILDEDRRTFMAKWGIG